MSLEMWPRPKSIWMTSFRSQIVSTGLKLVVNNMFTVTGIGRVLVTVKNKIDHFLPR